jgi:hypothetical protein
MTTDKLAVSQEAQEAAAEFVSPLPYEEHPLAVAFARFEAQARLAGKREGMEAAAQFVREWNGSTADGNTLFIADALDEIATAIRERKP